MLVPSLPWQNDRLYLKTDKKYRFSCLAEGLPAYDARCGALANPAAFEVDAQDAAVVGLGLDHLLRNAHHLFFERFPDVCPEPVLVK